ncbi:MAG: class I SAM-dependent methyltransferase, partial [Candidatus Sungbacteria bacterium]|nr:class I SAM-dependent methyltransferase [Candidatus Sungbacteria bacterium]
MEKERTEFLHTILSCPKDRSALRRAAPDAFECPTCRGNFSAVGGKVFFSEPPADVEVSNKGVFQWSRWKHACAAYFVKEFERQSPSNVLIDVGAGAGGFRSIISRFERVVGIDFYPYDTVDIVSDIQDSLPVRNQCGDIVLLSNVLEHVSRPEEVLAECRRILKPGGVLVGAVPFLMEVHQAPYDFHRYTSFRLRRMIFAAGFSNVSVTPLGDLADAYETTQRQFFLRALSALPERSILRRVSVRLWRKAS